MKKKQQNLWILQRQKPASIFEEKLHPHLLWHYIFRFLEHCALAPRPDWMTTLETPIADAEVERMISNNSENYGENISSHSDPSKDPSSIDYYTKVTTNDLKNDLSIAGSK